MTNPPSQPTNTSVFIVVKTSVAYNDGYNMPDTPEKYYTDRNKALLAAATLNLSVLLDREMLCPFPDTDMFQLNRDRISWDYKTAAEAQSILEDEVAPGLHHLSKLNVSELMTAVGDFDINEATDYQFEGDWYGVVELKLATE